MTERLAAAPSLRISDFGALSEEAVNQRCRDVREFWRGGLPLALEYMYLANGERFVAMPVAIDEDIRERWLDIRTCRPVQEGCVSDGPTTSTGVIRQRDDHVADYLRRAWPAGGRVCVMPEAQNREPPPSPQSLALARAFADRRPIDPQLGAQAFLARD